MVRVPGKFHAMSPLELLTFVLISAVHSHPPASGGGVVVASSSRTPPRLKAGAVLERVQKRYEAATDFRAHFEQKQVAPALRLSTVLHGVVLFKQPGSMRWDYQAPESRSFVSDGTTLWIYQSESKEVFRQGLKRSQLPSALAFLTGHGKLTSEFEVKLAGKTSYGRPGDYVLSLVRKQPQPTVKSVLLVVDPVTFEVRETVVIDATDGTSDMILSDVKVNSGIPNGTFAPPSSARVTDLDKAPGP